MYSLLVCKLVKGHSQSAHKCMPKWVLWDSSMYVRGKKGKLAICSISGCFRECTIGMQSRVAQESLSHVETLTNGNVQ